MVCHVSLCYATSMRCWGPLQCNAMPCDAMESNAVHVWIRKRDSIMKEYERHQPVTQNTQIHFPRLGARLQLHKFIENQRCPATNSKFIAFGVLPGASRKLMHSCSAQAFYKAKCNWHSPAQFRHCSAGCIFAGSLQLTHFA